MEIETFKRIIEQHENSPYRNEFLKKCREGEAYFRNKNDIKRRMRIVKEENPLKTADNRISHSWHGLLVNQKVGYLFGKDPNIDTGDKATNDKINKVLGDEWHKTLSELVITAANKAVAWLHFWVEGNSLEYGIVPTEEIIPIFSQDLKRRLIGVARKYRSVDDNGNVYVKYEYWDDKECHVFSKYGSIYTYNNCIPDTNGNASNCFTHNFGRVPFLYFNNNSLMENDLYMYKDLVDEYDKVVSGFSNDIEDIQEIIFVLQGYGGEELAEFMSDLKEFKAVKTDDKGDVRTIKAEIPVEARNSFRDDLKKAIFLFGMGVNPDKDSLGDSSGVALKFLYSLLELKASATRTEFDCSIKVFVRVILKHLGLKDDVDINITYYKNMITNDKEVTEILSKSDGIISDKTKTKNHPYTDDVDEELAQIKTEEEQEPSDYPNGFGSGSVSDGSE